MFYHLLYPLRDIFLGFNVFGYISFRAVGAALTALIISFLFVPKIIRILSFYQIGETIRDSGPKSHLKKEGTPTMGGIIMLLSIILPSILWAKLNEQIITIVIATLFMGMIGFLDDYLKIVKKISKGLIARYKLIAQIFVRIFIAYMVLYHIDKPIIFEDSKKLSDEQIELIDKGEKNKQYFEQEEKSKTSISIPFMASNTSDKIGNFLNSGSISSIASLVSWIRLYRIDFSALAIKLFLFLKEIIR